jgi:putative MATE family efflux protein
MATTTTADRSLDRTIVRLAVPALGALAIEPAYVLVDTAIVGHLGTTPLAGLAIAAQVLTIATSLVNFLAYGTTQRFARQRGAGRPDLAALVGVQALWLCATIGVPFATLIAVAARPFSAALGADGEVLEVATTYLRISALGLPFVLVALVGHGVLRGERNMTTPLRVVAWSAGTNVVLEVVAVYWLDLGVAGSAWSTVVVQWAAAGVYLALLRPRLVGAPTRRPVPHELRAMLAIGGLLVARVGALLVAFTVATAVAARVDDPTLAAHQVVNAAFLLCALALDALAIPAQTLVAEAVGSRDGALAAHVGHRVLVLSARAGAGLAAVVALSAPLVARIFSGDPEVISRTVAGLVVLAVMVLPGSVTFGLDGVLIGAGRYRAIALVMVAATGVFLVAIAPTVANPSLGIVGVWAALTVWMAARAAGMGLAWRTTRNALMPAAPG